MPEFGDEVEPAVAVAGGEAAAEPAAETGPAAEVVADPDLLAAVPLARQALAEITPEDTVGDPLGHVVEGPGVVSLLFASRLPGYPDWRWTVTVGRTDDAEPTVLEAELMPGDGSLLAPDWVPWSERLAEYQAAQEALAAQEADSSEAEDDEADDDGFDDSEDDHDVHDLHEDDDLDGVDIDSVDVGYDDETDVDADLDLEAEEAAALADAESDEDDDSDDDDSADDDSDGDDSADDDDETAEDE